MSCARVLLAVDPLRLTLVVVVGVATAVVVILIAILAARHGEVARADRARERVRGELGPVFSRFLETEDPVRLADALRPAFMRMKAAERPVQSNGRVRSPILARCLTSVAQAVLYELDPSLSFV